MPAASATMALLGRERESAELYDALTRALKGDRQTVVVGGDAGIGKTTLVSELGRRAEELGFSVFVGHCLDIDAGVAFGAVIEAVGEMVGRLEDVDSRPNARRMRALLDPDTPRSPEPFRVLEDLRQTVLEAAGAGPVMLVLEDMQWAGRSTQDFATALSRRGRGRLLVVLTVRTDDLHRRHPARRTLAEISRDPGARRVDLEPLDRAGIAGIVAARSGGSADPSVVGSVLERSEGNPLYAEELLAAGPQAIPEHLSDLFLARVGALSDDSRELLRVASVDGTRVDVEVLGDVAGLDQAQLDAGLRELVDANLLRGSDGALMFRHGLLREAVYDDLLPDERTRLHAAFATVLQARVDAEPDPRLATISRLAFHWSAAHDLPRTLATSVRAGLAAKQLGVAEAVTLLERALSLWSRTPDPETVAGHPKAELLVLLGEACKDQGGWERMHSLVREAVALLGPDTDPALASRVYSALGECWVFNGDTIGRQEAIRLAIECAGDEPSEQLARALVAQSTYHRFGDHRSTRCLTVARAAAEAASTVGCIDAWVEALRNCAWAQFELGRTGEAIATQVQTIKVSRDADRLGQVILDTDILAWLHTYAGQVDRGRATGRRGFEEGVALGLPAQAAMCGAKVQESLTWGGHFDQADTLLEELRELGITHYRWRWLHLELLLARGDALAAAPLMSQIMSGTPDEQDYLNAIELAALQDDALMARDSADRCFAEFAETESPLLAAASAKVGFHALSLATDVGDTTTDALSGEAARQLGFARAHVTDEWRGSYYGVQLALAEAYAARVAGEPAADEFRVAAGLAEPFGAYFALGPRLDLAQELLEHGHRDEGRELLVECWTAAHEMGAHGLERRALKLATRTRVPLPESRTSEGSLSRLTPREREVLDLLATGATNKAIADALFISQKTVSVHVSNLLAKLGAENRGAAAAMARELVG